MSSDREPRYVWVKSLGLNWLRYISTISEIGPLLGVVLLAAGGLMKLAFALYAGFAFIGIGFVAVFLYSFLFFRAIRCPKCGYNPTRKKDGSKKKNFRATETSVMRLVACPKCHGDDEVV